MSSCQRDHVIWWVDKIRPETGKTRVTKFSWPPALFSENFHRHIEDNHISHGSSFIRKGFKMRTVFVPMEIPQPDLALHRDALEPMRRFLQMLSVPPPPRDRCDLEHLAVIFCLKRMQALAFPCFPLLVLHRVVAHLSHPPPCWHLPWRSRCSQSYCGNTCWLGGRVSLLRWAGGDPTVELWEPEQRLRAQGSLNGDVLG